MLSSSARVRLAVLHDLDAQQHRGGRRAGPRRRQQRRQPGADPGHPLLAHERHGAHVQRGIAQQRAGALRFAVGAATSGKDVAAQATCGTPPRPAASCSLRPRLRRSLGKAKRLLRLALCAALSAGWQRACTFALPGSRAWLQEDDDQEMPTVTLDKPVLDQVGVSRRRANLEPRENDARHSHRHSKAWTAEVGNLGCSHLRLQTADWLTAVGPHESDASRWRSCWPRPATAGRSTRTRWRRRRAGTRCRCWDSGSCPPRASSST